MYCVTLYTSIIFNYENLLGMTGTTPSIEIPLAGGMDGFTFGSRKSWPEYDLHTANVFFKNIPTELQAITYKGQFVAFRSKDYYVFPHEDIFATLHPIMEQLGGKIADRPLGDKKDRFTIVYGQNQKANVEANYITFEGKKIYKGTQLRANYKFDDEKFDVTGNGDIVHFGTTITNAIDGTMSMGISPFSERLVCTNGMMHLATAVQISEGIVQKMLKKNTALENNVAISNHVKTIMETSKSFDELMHKIKTERMTHLTKIPVEWITSRIYLIKESISLFKERYRQMTELVISQKQAELIATKMPKRLVDTLQWMEVKETTNDVKTADGTKQVTETKVVLKDPVKQWKAFNDITENLTHVDRAFRSKAWQYKKLDRILVTTV